MRTKMHVEEWEVDTGLVRGLIVEQFSHWAGLSLIPVKTDGTVNAVFRLGER